MTNAIKNVEWAGLQFAVGPNTFQPRASSLKLIDFVQGLPAWQQARRPRLLVDMCCGCGALGIALFLSQLDAFKRLLLLDASQDAVNSARINLTRYNLPGQSIRWFAGDPIDVQEEVFVVCNPPFMRFADVESDTQNWEQACLTSGNDGLEAPSLCLQSCVGLDGAFIMKSRVDQLKPLAGGLHQLIQSTTNSDVAFSYWGLNQGHQNSEAT